MNFNIENKVFVITGATGHLFSVISRALAKEGAKIALLDKGITSLIDLSKEINSNGGISKYYPMDVTIKGNHERSLEHILKDFGDVDIVINAAGINSPKNFFDITLDEWNNIIATNLTGTFLSSQIFGRYLYDNHKGSIINISSASSGPPLSKAFAYSASKSGVVNLTQNIARDLSPWTRCNAIRPGFFPSPWSMKHFIDPQRKEAILNHTPMRRFGHPEELTGAILFLASDTMSSFVTGAEITVDGGFSAMTI